MKKEIAKLGLTKKQYFVLGALMMLFCLLLGAGVFFIVDISLPLGIVLAVVAIESGFAGYCFCGVSSDISKQDDGVDANPVSDGKSSRNLVAVSALLAFIFVACIISVSFVAGSKLTKIGEKTAELSADEQSVQADSETDTADADDFQNSIVYATPNGERYHYSSKCAGSGSFAITIEEAQKHSLTPCRSCASEE